MYLHSKHKLFYSCGEKYINVADSIKGTYRMFCNYNIRIIFYAQWQIPIIISRDQYYMKTTK